MRKALVGAGDHFKIDVDGGGGGGDLTAHGNILDHEYPIESSGDTVASVSKGFRVRDIYGIEIQLGQDDALILAITAGLDAMTRDWRERPPIFDAAAVAPDRLVSGLRRFDPARPLTRLPLRP